MKKKKYFVCISCLILLIIFFIFYYKNSRNGNNIISKSQDEIIEYILNDFKEYIATIEVTVTSNRNENIYSIRQEVTENLSVEEVLSPESINGLKIQLEGNSLKVSNTELQLEKIYNNYETLLNNSLFLNVFIEDYKTNESKNYEENGKIILETSLENNSSTYIKYKKLYVDKETGKPTKLEIKDNTKKTRICIIYNDIEIK